MFPSLCELAGIEIPDYMQGTSFVPLLDNPDLSWKKAAFSQFHRRPKVAADGGRYMGDSINTAEHHYIEWFTWDQIAGVKGDFVRAELYDRIKDPYEKMNVVEQEAYQDITRELSMQLAGG